jgi:glycosyltransferase involved in cell wall biosynthesis
MKKTILFMAQLPPPVHGAALRNQSLLESELLNNEFNIISLPLKFIDDMKDLGSFSFKKILLMLKYCFRLTVILLKKKVDLVYFTMSPAGGAFYRDILFISIIKLFRKKRLLHFRVKGIKKTASSGIGRMLVKYGFAGSDIVCLSQHHMLDMADLTVRKPFVIPNGIKVETQYLHLTELYSSKDLRVPRLLFLSNLSVKKGIPDLIAALGILKKKKYEFTTSIVGNEWDMTFEEVQQLINAEDLRDSVVLEGPKFGRDKFEHIARSDIFVFPTYFELFPGVILEAMQFGKAIVSTFEGSIPEMIDNNINGLLVEPQNPQALADAIGSLFCSPQKIRELGERASEKFFDEFTLEAFERKMHGVFHQLLSN